MTIQDMKSKTSIFSALICFFLFSSVILAEPPREDPRPRDPERGRSFPQRPEPGHAHYDDHGQYLQHPGYHFVNLNWHPKWALSPHFKVPEFKFILSFPEGVWQCLAFDEEGEEFADYGPDEQQAAYATYYSCAGSPDYQAAGCDIPQHYCQPR